MAASEEVVMAAGVAVEVPAAAAAPEPKKKRTPRIPGSQRAGIIFPPARTKRKLKKLRTGDVGRVGASAAVFLPCHIEDMVA